MNKLGNSFIKIIPVFIIILIINVILLTIETLSGSLNIYFSIFFIILNLTGAWILRNIWQKNRQSPKSEED